MNVEIPFGDRTIEVTLPDRTFVPPPSGQRNLSEPLGDVEAAISDALARPLGSPAIRELADSNSRVVIAFDDLTVPCFSPLRGLAIAAVLAELDAGSVPEENVRLICANSLHRKFRREELALVIGDELVKRFGDRLLCHDGEDEDALTYLGKTPENGYDVEVSRFVADSDLTVYVSAGQNRGFSGGWKSVCVGLSTFRSIRHHHTPDGMSMSVRDNRMHRVLDEMGRRLESQVDTTFFKIDCIETDPFHTSHVFAGDTWACREAVLEVLQGQYPARRSLATEKQDVVIYGVPAWSPYAIFSRMNPILTLISSGLGYLGGMVQALGREGCTVIMATPCPDEWDDATHPSYRHVWEHVLTQTLDPYVIEREYTDEYAEHDEFVAQYRNGFAFHPVHGILATHPLRRLKHIGRVIVAGIENRAVAEHLGFDTADSVEAALHMAEDVHGSDCNVAYIRHPASQAVTKVPM